MPWDDSANSKTLRHIALISFPGGYKSSGKSCLPWCCHPHVTAMGTNSGNRIVCALFLAITWMGLASCQSVSICQAEDDNLTGCVFALVDQIANATDMAEICRVIEDYVRCEHLVKIRCPDNAVINNPDYDTNVRMLVGILNQHCPRNVSEVLCEPDAFYNEYAAICHPLALQNTVAGIPLELMCRHTRQYLRCQQTVNAPCVHMENNLERAISITKTGLTAQCGDDFNQLPERVPMGLKRDTSAVGGEDQDPEGEAPSGGRPDCSDNRVNAGIGLCMRHVFPVFGNQDLANKHVCKYTRRYLRCFLRLMNKCPDADMHRDTIYDPVKARMLTMCEVNTRRCPFDVSERQVTISEYCSNSEAPAEVVGSEEFCRAVRQMPRCMVRIKNRCKDRGFKYSDIRASIQQVNATYNQLCDSDVAKRSTAFADVARLEVEERSNAPADWSEDTEAIFDGDEVNQVEIAVHNLQDNLNNDPQPNVPYQWF